MATYFHGQNSDIHTADGLQTLVLMNPAFTTHYSTPPAIDPSSSASPANTLFFLNPAANPVATPASALPHAPPPPQSTTSQFVSVALPAIASSSQSREDYREMVPAMHGFLPRAQYGAWSSMEQSAAIRGDVLHGHQQGLSLSLSSQQHQGFVPQGFGGDEREAPVVSVCSPSSASGVTNGGGVGGVSVLLGLKYLKAAQELLEEVASVGLGYLAKSETPRKGSGGSSKVAGGESSVSVKEDGSGSGGGDRIGRPELSAAERQEIHAKKAKLAAMLEEV